MKLYVLYDKKQDKLIARMKGGFDTTILGAIDPKNTWHTNSMENLIVTGIKKEGRGVMGLEGWWKWALEDDAPVEIHEEFLFDPKDIEIKKVKVS